MPDPLTVSIGDIFKYFWMLFVPIFLWFHGRLLKTPTVDEMKTYVKEHTESKVDSIHLELRHSREAREREALEVKKIEEKIDSYQETVSETLNQLNKTLVSIQILLAKEGISNDQ